MIYRIPDPSDPRWEAEGNPFTAYLAALDGYAYSHPTPGVKARIIVLGCVVGV